MDALTVDFLGRTAGSSTSECWWRRRINGEGKRGDHRGWTCEPREDGAFWLAFLRSLSVRGLSGRSELLVSDADQGFCAAIGPVVFGGASSQRCQDHRVMHDPVSLGSARRAQPLGLRPWSAPSTSNPPTMRYTPRFDRVILSTTRSVPRRSPRLLDEAVTRRPGLLQLPTRPPGRSSGPTTHRSVVNKDDPATHRSCGQLP